MISQISNQYPFCGHWWHGVLLRVSVYAYIAHRIHLYQNAIEDKHITRQIQNISGFTVEGIDWVTDTYIRYHRTGMYQWCDAIKFRKDWVWCVLLAGHMEKHLGGPGRAQLINRLINEVENYDDRLRYWQQMWQFYKPQQSRNK